MNKLFSQLKYQSSPHHSSGPPNNRMIRTNPPMIIWVKIFSSPQELGGGGETMHMPIFVKNGLAELWFKGGVGDSTRYVPLHILYMRLGGQFCLILPAIHSLTGCDITRK